MAHLNAERPFQSTSKSQRCAYETYLEGVPNAQLCSRTSNKGSFQVSSTISKRTRLDKRICENGVETLYILFGDSTLRNKYEYLATFGNSTAAKYCVGVCETTVCYLQGTNAAEKLFGHAIETNNLTSFIRRANKTIVILNFGLHHLHLWPARKFFSHTISSLERNIRSQLESIYLTLTKAPNKVVMYKMTNAICTDNFLGSYSNALMEWHDSTTHHRDCYAHVQRKLNVDLIEAEEICEHLTFNNTGVQTVNSIALKVLTTFPEALVLDDYALTFNRCTCTAMQDGRHYGPLIPIWWDFVLNILKSCTP